MKIKHVVVTLALSLGVITSASAQLTNSNSAPPISLALPLNLDFLTNLPTSTNITAWKIGVGTGVEMANSDAANYIKVDGYFRTNFIVSGEIQNAPVSTVLSSVSIYGGYRIVWPNAELSVSIGGRRSFDNTGVPVSFQCGTLLEASWYPFSWSTVAATGGLGIWSSPTGNVFDKAPVLTPRLGVKIGF